MDYYLYIKTFHVVAIIAWMAMLFYLPRLFVYHAEHNDKKEFCKVVEVQERLLYKAIGLPAFWAALISGAVLLVINPALFKDGWLHVKLLVLALLTAYSFSLEYYRNRLKEGSCKRSGKFFRAYNEVPTLFSIIIVTCVVTKEFYPMFTLFMTALFALTAFIIMRKKQKNQKIKK
ncbi:MAG: protoporphyrinogen oxidase HemJ [Campylobacteraceae bacterium]|jgi:putative membrane protein|nr:protoporphyrinogen oxidase HemJ [Campylobacteraceae bacterium]